MIRKLFCCGMLALSGLLVLVVIEFPLLGQEKAGVWTLDVKFENPKTAKVEIPGQGERTIWYLEYEVINKTKKEREFSPVFGLVSNKRKKEVSDEILISAEEKLGAGRFNSITVSKEAIPAGGKIQAVAYFYDDDVTATDFTVYVRGLSNSFTTQGKKTEYKTLQLEFRRGGEGQPIKPVGAQKWVNRVPAKDSQ